MKKKKIPNKYNGAALLLLFAMLYIFFSTTNYFINYLFLILILVANMFILMKRKQLRFDSFSVIFLFFLMICFISLFSISNKNILNGVIFILCALLFLLSYVNLTNSDNNWKDSFINMLKKFSYLFAGATLLQIFIPGVINIIKGLYVQGSKISLSQYFITSTSVYGGYNGLVVQTGTNAFLLCLFIGYVLFKILSNDTKGKKKYIIMLIVGYILLLLTSKRTLLIASLVSMIFVISIYKKFKIKYILLTVFVVLTSTFLVFNYTDLGNKIVKKMGDGEINLSGREELYKEMKNNFIENPIIGVGIDSKAANDRDGHNIYLQVASETGIVGILLLVVFLLRNLIFSIKKTFTETKNRELFALSMYVQLIFIIWGLTGNTLYDQFALFTYFVFVALGTYCSYENKKMEVI